MPYKLRISNEYVYAKNLKTGKVRRFKSHEKYKNWVRAIHAVKRK
jgi:hypothetical protein